MKRHASWPARSTLDPNFFSFVPMFAMIAWTLEFRPVEALFRMDRLQVQGLGPFGETLQLTLMK